MRILEPGDVIQIKPTQFVEQEDVKPAAPCFWGCLAVIDEVRKWGVLASILVPVAGQGKETPPGEFPTRLPNGTFVYIGISVYGISYED